MGSKTEVVALLTEVRRTADRLLDRVHSESTVSAADASAFRRQLARLPRGTDAVAPWVFSELDETLRLAIEASRLPLPAQGSLTRTVSRAAARRSGRENTRLVALRERLERFEARIGMGESVLSCDVANLESDLCCLRSGRRATSDDKRQIDELSRRTRALRAGWHSVRASRSSAGHGFWDYPAIGTVPLAAGQMRHGPRTPNKGRPARSAWSFNAGLPSLGKR